MSSEHVCSVIECLCQILTQSGFSIISSEIFHLAKFNQNQATIPLWRLIYEMIYFNDKMINQDELKKQFDQTLKNELVDKMKQDLFKLGYTYENFLSVDNQMETGSQQLLVCIGWLIYHMKIIEKSLQLNLNSIRTIDQINENFDSIEQIKQIINSNRKIRLYLEKMKNKNCQIFSNDQQFDLLTHYFNELENEDYRLNLFLFWNQNENIFWKWMESVLDQPPTIVECNQLTHDGNCQYLEAEKEKFNATIDTLDNALVQLEQLWISNNKHLSIERDISSIITSIDTEISYLFKKFLNKNSLIVSE